MIQSARYWQRLFKDRIKRLLKRIRGINLMNEKALFNISYGLYVLGIQAENYFGGCVIDAVAQVSGGQPPVIILGSMNNNLTNRLIKDKGEFTLSILPENVHPFVIANFGFQSAKDVDKWANTPHTVKDGLPILDGAAAYLRCRTTEAKELATHTAFFCEVTDAWQGENSAKPLIYGDYQREMKSAAIGALKAWKDTGKTPGTNISGDPPPSAAPGSATAAAEKYQCRICGYICEGSVPFEDLPNDWVCPLCGVGKESFEIAG
jgi:flavin reductase (DIM6/NTAB) family NADH-FMN oxidoreductase RutF/rubredoxin